VTRFFDAVAATSENIGELRDCRRNIDPTANRGDGKESLVAKGQRLDLALRQSGWPVCHGDLTDHVLPPGEKATLDNEPPLGVKANCAIASCSVDRGRSLLRG
jgi:hypothetical protein